MAIALQRMGLEISPIAIGRTPGHLSSATRRLDISALMSDHSTIELARRLANSAKASRNFIHCMLHSEEESLSNVRHLGPQGQHYLGFVWPLFLCDNLLGQSLLMEVIHCMVKKNRQMIEKDQGAFLSRHPMKVINHFESRIVSTRFFFCVIYISKKKSFTYLQPC